MKILREDQINPVTQEDLDKESELNRKMVQPNNVATASPTELPGYIERFKNYTSPYVNQFNNYLTKYPALKTGLKVGGGLAGAYAMYRIAKKLFKNAEKRKEMEENY